MSNKKNYILYYILLISTAGYSISCGVQTAYYATKSHILKIKNVLLLMLIGLCGFMLNFILYSGNIDAISRGFDSSLSLPKGFLVVSITLASSIAMGIFAYHSALGLINSPFVNWFLAITAGIASFVLLYKDFADHLSKKHNKNAADEKSSVINVDNLMALILVLIFIAGTAGFIWTVFNALNLYMSPPMAGLLVACLAISELFFVWGEAKKAVKKIKEGRIKQTLKAAGVMLLFILPAIINAAANGILSSSEVSGNIGIAMAACAGILSLFLMINSFMPEDGKNVVSLQSILEKIKLANNSVSGIYLFLSLASFLAIPTLYALSSLNVITNVSMLLTASLISSGLIFAILFQHNDFDMSISPDSKKSEEIKVESVTTTQPFDGDSPCCFGLSFTND